MAYHYIQIRVSTLQRANMVSLLGLPPILLEAKPLLGPIMAFAILKCEVDIYLKKYT